MGVSLKAVSPVSADECAVAAGGIPCESQVGVQVHAGGWPSVRAEAQARADTVEAVYSLLVYPNLYRNRIPLGPDRV